VWPHAAFAQRATCPPRAAVRQSSAGVHHLHLGVTEVALIGTTPSRAVIAEDLRADRCCDQRSHQWNLHFHVQTWVGWCPSLDSNQQPPRSERGTSTDWATGASFDGFHATSASVSKTCLVRCAQSP
jgi:hypothetical protein